MFAVGANSAHALVYSVTTTGTIGSGYGYVDGLGLFGLAGASLVGSTFSITNSFDTSQNYFFENTPPYGTYTTGYAPFTVSVTVNGVTFDGYVGGFFTSSTGRITNQLSNLGVNFDEVQSSSIGYDASFNQWVVDMTVASFSQTFVGSDADFGMDLTYLPNPGEGFAQFKLENFDGAITYFSSANITTFVVNNGTSVPEPATLGLLAVGMLGLISARRKRAS